VIDTGIGIPHDAQVDIFDRFGSLNDHLHREIEGTGLGLNISKQLSRLHGGDLVVTSEPGKGSTFTFTLPIATPEQMALEKPNLQINESFAVFKKSITLSDVFSILLVEDEVSIREMLRHALEAAGYVVVDTHDGAQVVELASGILPDMIILDVNLPHLSGWEVMQQLQIEPATRTIPVIVYTASPDRTRALRLGAAAFVAKPATPADVIDVVRQVIAASLAVDDLHDGAPD
jgi:CheY-like chemotaxis protein